MSIFDRFRPKKITEQTGENEKLESRQGESRKVPTSQSEPQREQVPETLETPSSGQTDIQEEISGKETSKKPENQRRDSGDAKSSRGEGFRKNSSGESESRQETTGKTSSEKREPRQEIFGESEISRGEGSEGASAYQETVSPVTADRFVEHMLLRLNCESKTEDRPHSVYYIFDYQGGHFRVDASKHNTTVGIEFPIIYDTVHEHINLVRTLCNEMNYRTRFSRFCYSFDEKANRLLVHILTGFNVPEDQDDPQGMFKGILESHFGLQREFGTQIEERLKALPKEAVPVDFEQEDMIQRRMSFVIRETELSHQNPNIPARANADTTLTIGNILRPFLPEVELLKFQEMRVVTDTLLIMSGEEKILNTNILSVLLEGDGQELKLTASEVTYIIQGERETVTLQVTPKVESDKAIYFRVRLMCPALRASAHALAGRELASFAFLVAYDKTTEENHEAEFRYMWEDAKEKMANKKQQDLTDEQKLISYLNDSLDAMRLYWGQKYFEQKRFPESLLHMEPLFRKLNLSYQHLDERTKEVFYRVCLFMGWCYTEMGLYEKAFYYLDIVFRLQRFEDAAAYVNCLVNARDFRAIYVINTIMEHLEGNAEDEPDDEEGEESSEPENLNLIKFKNFLRRRKAYVLIDLGMLDDAEKLCQELLKEPANADFALGELAFIQELKDNKPKK